tara:strand:- start:1891 stop:2088 length:198 start_codon:yes stop_codon:yes gene_type:complete
MDLILDQEVIAPSCRDGAVAERAKPDHWKGKAACLEFFEHRGVVVGAVVEHIFGLSCLENPKTPT